MTKKGSKSKKKEKLEKKLDFEYKKIEKKEKDQHYGLVKKMLGNCRLIVLCDDGKERLCHIRGKIKSALWIKEDDIVLLSLREFDTEKADILFRFDNKQVNKLIKMKEIPPDCIIIIFVVEKVRNKNVNIDNFIN